VPASLGLLHEVDDLIGLAHRRDDLKAGRGALEGGGAARTAGRAGDEDEISQGGVA
jgi:hypothetical protein